MKRGGNKIMPIILCSARSMLKGELSDPSLTSTGPLNFYLQVPKLIPIV